jgi:hypothetical protein
MNNTKRICIYPKDIMRVTGKSERYCRKLLELMKVKYSKNEHQFISVDEFCEFTGLKIEQVKDLITD